MLRTLWKNLKRWRTVRLGPIAFVFKFDRSVEVTRNPRRGVTRTVRQQYGRVGVSPPPAIKVDGEPARRPADGPRQTGELALVVGVGPGFGHALAKRLANEGLTVVMASRKAHRLDPLVREIESGGGLAFAYGCDATSETSVEELFAHICERHGVPNLVVYSLQSSGSGHTVDIELPAFEQAWRHNCLGAFLVSREAARLMLPLRRGTIILTGSTSSLLGRAGHLNLSVGKFGQRALAQVLARELWPKGIHVAHLVIDADIDDGEERDEGGPQADPDHISQAVISLHRQPNTAWTSEVDVRPWNEQFWNHC